MANTDSFGNIYFPAAIAAGNYPITLNTPTHVLVAGAGGIISRVATSQLISNTDVTSVYGRQGAITALPGDYDTDMVKEKTNLYFSNGRARAALSVTTTGTTGPATYNALTGVINIPQYQNDFSGVASFNTRTGAVTLTALDVTTALTYTPIAVETDPVWAAQKVLYYTKVQADGLFSLVDHTHTTSVITEGTNLYFTNARARAAITLTTTGTSGAATYANGVFNIPNYTTDLTGYATETYVTTQISNLVDAAPATLNTLNELAAALGDDANFSTTITTLIGTKEPAITAGTTSQYWRGDKTWQTLPSYSLPIATGSILGGIKVGSGLSINATSGVLDATYSYTLPTASTTILGGVKVDGTTITINGSGVISGANTYSLPIASGTVLGGIKVGTNLSIDANGILSSTDTNTTYANFTRTVSGLVPNPGGSSTNRYLREDGTWVIPPDTDTNTWNANSVNVAGYVAAPGAVANKVWKTDGSGNPAWRDDADTTYTLAGLGGLALSGGTMTGAIVLKEGAANGLKFPNDVFGGSGDTAGMRLITRSGESMSLEVYLTNDADDWFNISVPSGDGAKVNGNTIWHAGNLTNLNQLSNGPGYLTSLSGAVLTTYNSSLNSDSRNSRGVTRLYRRDDDSDYSVQTYWTGSHWFIRGYNGDSFHAEARVGYSDSTGSVAWSNVSSRPTALSEFTNNLGNYGGWVVRTGDTMTGTLTVNTSATTNDVALFYSVEPHVDITAAGASNTAALRLFPTEGYNALIGQFRSSGRLVLVASNTEAVFVDKSAMTIGTGSALNSELILYSSNYGNGYATKLQGRNSDGKLWFQYRENSTTWTDVVSIASAGVTATAYYEFSDVRFKNVLETNPSVVIDGIDVIKFTRKGDTQIRYGYSAQQIKKILPDAVEGTDKLVVNYVDVHTLKIAALEKRIAELEAKLNSYGV